MINNLPEHIEKLFIFFYEEKNHDKKIDNLPPSLKEIIIEDEYHKEYFTKIPFGVKFTIIPKFSEIE